MKRKLALALLIAIITAQILPAVCQNVYPGRQGAPNMTIPGDKGMVIPHGTTAQRPVSPLDATVRVNDTTGELEFYSKTAGVWQDASGGGGGAVSSVTGTANQVTASPTTGAVVLTLPSTIILPGTSAFRLQSGTTAQRPTGANGELRYNSTATFIEMWSSTFGIQNVGLSGTIPSTYTGDDYGSGANWMPTGDVSTRPALTLSGLYRYRYDMPALELNTTGTHWDFIPLIDLTGVNTGDVVTWDGTRFELSSADQTSVTPQSGAGTASTGMNPSDATGGAFALALPTAIGNTGMVIDVKKTDSSINTVTIDPFGAQTIDGAATYVLMLQYDSVSLVSDGSNWLIK